MYIAVDGTENEQTIRGWNYTNKDGDVECVKVSHTDYVEVTDSSTRYSCIYYEDIPKAIKALQAAYNWNKENSIE